MQQDCDFTTEDREKINPGNALSISTALDFVKNPVKCCEHMQDLIQRLMDIVRIKKDDPKTKGVTYVAGWGKIILNNWLLNSTCFSTHKSVH
jgi:inositol hexakisphosphate/diphosphoinositol-pentakisphosphate kinase